VDERNERPRTVADVGEFGLIERLVSRLGPPRSDVWVGIGDDVAAIALDERRLLLVTCDVQVAGTHFVLEGCDPRRLGQKLAAINLSDIAAAGGEPTHFVVSLILPGDTELAFLETLYDGLDAEARRFGADVVGGNVSRGGSLAIDVTLLGEATPGGLLRRDGARPGDRVIVTGSLGGAAAGLALRRNPALPAPREIARHALDALETPTPRLRESRALVELGGASAAIDLSDGLLADLGHLCDRSGVGARLSLASIPIHRAALALAPLAGGDARDWALRGGEDYELLFTAAPERACDLARAVTDRTGTPATVIGEIVAEATSRTIVLPDGSSIPLDAGGGWRHF
jgi:thiamine-monophosphate kinase